MRTKLLLLAMLAVTIAGCSSLLLHPSRQYLATPATEAAGPKDVFFPNGEGATLHGWFLRAREPAGTILVFHGNAENLSSHVNGLLWLVAAGFNVFIIDYRGFGLSTGRPTLGGIHRDGVAAFEYLSSLSGVDAERIAVLGQSIGGSVAVYVAATAPRREKIRLLVLDSSLYDYRLIAREKLADLKPTWALQYPLSLLFGTAYSPSRWIQGVSAATVLMADLRDRVVPSHHSERLFAGLRSGKELWTTNLGGHIVSFADPDLRERLVARLQRNFR